MTPPQPVWTSWFRRISPAEIVCSVEKNRLTASAYEDSKNAPTDPEYVIEEAPFHGKRVEAMLNASVEL
jgi:hypothetical protein